MIETVNNALVYVGSIVGLLSFIACIVSGNDLRNGYNQSGLNQIPPTKRRVKVTLYLFGAIVSLSSSVIYLLVAIGIIDPSSTAPLFRPIHIAALGVVGGLAIINSS